MSVPCLKLMNTRPKPVVENELMLSIPRTVESSSSSGRTTFSITSRPGESDHGTLTARNGAV